MFLIKAMICRISNSLKKLLIFLRLVCYFIIISSHTQMTATVL